MISISLGRQAFIMKTSPNQCLNTITIYFLLMCQSDKGLPQGRTLFSAVILGPMPFIASALLELLALPLDFVHLAVKGRENVKS